MGSLDRQTRRSRRLLLPKAGVPGDPKPDALEAPVFRLKLPSSAQAMPRPIRLYSSPPPPGLALSPHTAPAAAHDDAGDGLKRKQELRLRLRLGGDPENMASTHNLAPAPPTPTASSPKRNGKRKKRLLSRICHECRRSRQPMLTCTRPNCHLSFHPDCILQPLPVRADRHWTCPCHVDAWVEDTAALHRLPVQPVRLLVGLRGVGGGQCAEQTSVAVPESVRQAYSEALEKWRIK